jgi:hypothetical protein
MSGLGARDSGLGTLGSESTFFVSRRRTRFRRVLGAVNDVPEAEDAGRLVACSPPATRISIDVPRTHAIIAG